MPAAGEERLDDRPLEEPSSARLDPAHPARREILERHVAAMAAGAPTYTDPVLGVEVFTAAFLAARGRCCGSGCRHCPFVGCDGEPSR